MSGKKGAQRTKGNVKPSSSGRAAELLASKGSDGQAFGFANFSSAVAYPSDIAESFLKEAAASDNVISTDAEFRIILKKMNKRDAVTKLKGLQEFIACCKVKEDDALVEIIPFFIRVYGKLIMEYDVHVRAAAQSAFQQLVTRVPSQLATPAFLKGAAGVWLFAQCDPYAPAAAAARSTFAAVFPTPVEQSSAMLSCLNESISVLSDLLLNSTAETFSDPKGTPLDEVVEKLERVVACSLYALRRLLQVVAGEESNRGKAEPLAKEVASTVKGALWNALSDARFWRLAKHECVLVREGFYAFVSSVCLHVPELMLAKADKICPLVLGNLHSADRVTCSFIWEAVLAILLGVTNWWNYVNIRKAVLPSLWSMLRHGGNGFASITHPNCLPFLSCLVEISSSPAFGDLHGFLVEFLSNMREGMMCDKVQRSPATLAFVTKSFVDCIGYAIHKEVECGLDAATIESALVDNQLIAATRSSIVQRSAVLAESPFYVHIRELLVNWYKRSLNVSQTQKDFVTKTYVQLVGFFWSRLTEVCLEVLATTSATDGADERAIAQDLPTRIAQDLPTRIAHLVCVMADDSNEKSRPAVSATASGILPTFGQPDSSGIATTHELLKMGAAVSFAMLSAITERPFSGPAETIAMAYADGLTRIIGSIACPQYFASLTSRLTVSKPDAAAAYDCRPIVSQLVQLIARNWESSERVPLLVKLVSIFGQYLEGDTERLNVLRDLCSAKPNADSLPRIVLQTMVSVDIWQKAIAEWSTSSDFREVVLGLADHAIQCMRAGDDQNTAHDLTSVFQVACCLPAHRTTFLEGTAAILKATKEMLAARPVLTTAVSALKYISKILSCCEVLPFEAVSLGMELYRLTIDGHAHAEMSVDPTVCCQVAEQLCRSPEFKARLSDAVMSDITGIVPFDRLDDIIQTLFTLEPTLNKSFMEGFVMQHIQHVMSTSWDRLAQWLTVQAVRCDILLESYQIFDPSPRADAAAPGMDHSDRQAGLPTALPFICLSLLAAFSERRVRAEHDVLTEAPSQDMPAARVHCNYSYLCNPRYLCAALWVTGCWREAISSGLAAEVTRVYNADVLGMITGYLKELDWSWFDQDSLEQIHLVDLMIGESCAGRNASGCEYLVTDILTKELSSLNGDAVTPDLLESLTRLTSLTKKEFHGVLSAFPHSQAFKANLNSDLVMMLLDRLTDAIINEDLSNATRVLYLLIAVFSLSDSLLTGSCSCSIVDIIMTSRKWAMTPLISEERHLKEDVAVLQWTLAVMMMLGRIALQTSFSLSSKHWDFMLCSLVEWTDQSCSLDRETWTFADAVFVANASSLLSYIAWSMKEQVTRRPADYPSGLLTEWAELHCQELFSRILPHVLNGPTRKIHASHGHRLALTFFCRAASSCPTHQLMSYALPPAKVAGIAAERRTLLGDEPSHFNAPLALNYVVDRLFVQLCSEEVSVQGAAYVLLLQLMPLMPKYSAIPVSEFNGNNIRPVPALFEWVLRRCIEGASGSVVENYEGKPRQTSVVTRCTNIDGRSDCTLLRTYLLTWKLLLKYLQCCSAESRVEHIEYLNQHQMVDTILNILVDFIPMEELANSKPGVYVFSRNATVNFDVSVDMQEEVLSLGYSLFYSVVHLLPVLVRKWKNDLDKKTSQVVDRFTARYVSSEIINEEMETLQAAKARTDNLSIKTRSSEREISVVYTVDNLTVKPLIKIPANYPVGIAEVECSEQHKVRGCEHQKWILQLLVFITQQNGSILDALYSWKQNVDKKLEGTEECPICSFILHGSNLQMPKLKCPTCKKLFHASCMYTWSQSSGQAKCPLCRRAIK